MSGELFDEDPRATAPARKRPTRSRALVITLGVLVVAFFGLTAFAAVYTDRLWFNSAGYGGVFSTMLWTRIGLFVAFGVLMGATVAANIYLAYRFRPFFRPQSPEQTNLDRYRDIITPIRTLVVIGVAVVMGAFAGTSGMGQWRTFLLWRNAEPFGGDPDPYFGRDIGFYVFHLPWLHFLVDFAMAVFVISILAAVVVHYLYGGIRLQAGDRFSGAAQVQLSALLGLFVLAKGVDYYLDRFDLVNDSNRLFTGMNFTAENAILPAKNILLGVAVICAILFFLNIWRRTWQLPSVGLALLALSAVLLGMIWPAVVQQFQVKPSEADREAPYIEKNIASTRAAYNLTDVDVQSYTPDSTLTSSATALDGQTSSIPLVDPKIVQPAFQQTQQVRAFYSVAPVLDVDRYEIDGVDRALVLGVRELNQAGIPPGDQNWSNLHTVYTHGNGLIAAYANQRPEDNDEQINTVDGSSVGIEWAQGTQATEDDLAVATGGYEERVYYGEQSPEYSVVGKADEDANDVELNLPAAGSDEGTTTTYDGEGDASVGSTFNQLMFAIKYGEPNFLLSGRVNENSEVLFNRTPRERVEKVAPWLTVDSDAYPAVIDNRIQWIVDGYTTTDRFPGSQRESFETMTDDSLQVNTGIQTLPTDEINYMRNAVKATVDAYDGTVKLYEWDDEDPILQTWKKAFPGTVLDREEIPDQLLEHLRYPEDLFKVQRYQFARYHVTEAGDWYQGNNRWAVPQDPYAENTFQPPYRLFTDGTGEAADGETTTDDTGEQTFSLTSVYVPSGKNNLASFMSVDADATSDTYGQIKVLELPNEQTPGPGLVANQFASDPDVADALAEFNRSGASVVYGNVLTLPINDGLMYVQPIYATREVSDSSYPVLRYVLTKYGDEIGFGPTLRDSISNLLTDAPPDTSPPDTGGEDPETPPGENEGDGGTGGEDPTGTVQEQINTRLTQAESAFTAADTALQAGDLAEYQRQVEIAQTRIGQAIALSEGGAAGGGGGDAGDTGGSDATAAESPAP